MQIVVWLIWMVSDVSGTTLSPLGENGGTFVPRVSFFFFAFGPFVLGHMYGEEQ